MRIQPHSDMMAIVLVGNFNPAIFHPAWFGLQNLVGKRDVENATVQVTHPEFSQFSVGGISVAVSLNHFNATCLTVHCGLIKDLVLGTFGEHLIHTPLMAVGINRQVHFDTGSTATRDCVGNKLAPKDAWGNWGKTLDGEKGQPTTSGGLVNLSMRQMRRPGHPDEYKGYIQTDVQPSTQLLMSGIYAQVNDHYELSEQPSAPGCRTMLDILETKWNWSMEYAESIIDQLMELTESCKV